MMTNLSLMLAVPRYLVMNEWGESREKKGTLSEPEWTHDLQHQLFKPYYRKLGYY